MAKQRHPGRPAGVFGLLQHQLGRTVLPPWGCPPLAGGMAPFDMLCCAMQAGLCCLLCHALPFLRHAVLCHARLCHAVINFQDRTVKLCSKHVLC